MGKDNPRVEHDGDQIGHVDAQVAITEDLDDGDLDDHDRDGDDDLEGMIWRLRADPAPRKLALEQMGEAVLRLRLFRGWTQSDVELAARVDQTTISRLERGGQRGLSIQRLARILDALRVGEISFSPPKPAIPPTDLELMLRGDPWQRAGDRAARRLARPARRRIRSDDRRRP